MFLLWCGMAVSSVHYSSVFLCVGVVQSPHALEPTGPDQTGADVPGGLSRYCCNHQCWGFQLHWSEVLRLVTSMFMLYIVFPVSEISIPLQVQCVFIGWCWRLVYCEYHIICSVNALLTRGYFQSKYLKIIETGHKEWKMMSLIQTCTCGS